MINILKLFRRRNRAENQTRQPLISWQLKEDENKWRGFDYTGRFVAQVIPGTETAQGLWRGSAYNNVLGYFQTVEQAKQAVEVYAIDVGDVY